MSANDPGNPLDTLIASARGDDPTDAQLARLEQRLAGLLIVPAGTGMDTPAAAGPAAAATGTGVLGKLLWTGVAVTALGGGGLIARRVLSDDAPAIVAVAHPDAPIRGASPPRPAKPDEPPLPPDASPDVTPQVDAAPATAIAPERPARERPQTATEALAAETRLLERAQAALRSGVPRKALQAIAEHEGRYPRGVLAEERERIAIEALLAQGRRPAAVARARAFETKFPRSMQLPRIRALLQGKP